MEKRTKIRVINSVSSLKVLIEEFRESDRKFLFRGTTKRYSEVVHRNRFSGEEMQDGINSFLYRWARDKVPFSKTFGPPHIEEEMLDEFLAKYPDLPHRREGMLTDLQHHLDNTNVIDFSNDLPIALFFMGNGYPSEDGEILIIERANIKDTISEIITCDEPPFIVKAVETDLSQEIVIFQRSVFIYPPAGYINKDLCYEIVQVLAKAKQPILDYLRDEYDIHAGTVFKGRSDKFSTNEISIETASVKCHYGIALCSKGQYEEAIENFDDSIQSNFNIFSRANAHNGRGVARYHLGRDDGAIEDYNKAIELKDDLAGAYNNRGLVKFQQGHDQEAISDFDKAITLEPNHAQAHNNRGKVMCHLGDKFGQMEYYLSAQVDYLWATRHDPNYANPFYNLGCIQLRLRLLREALESFSRVIDIQPRNAKAFCKRGQVYAVLREEEKARSAFLKAKELAEGDGNKELVKLVEERLNAENLDNTEYEDKKWTLEIRYDYKTEEKRDAEFQENTGENPMNLNQPRGSRRPGRLPSDVEVFWNSVTGATGYELEGTITNDHNGEPDRVVIVGGPTDSLTSKTFSGATFSFRVRSVKSVGDSLTRSSWSDRF